MKIINNFNFSIKSFTVENEDVYCIQVYPGETVIEKSGRCEYPHVYDRPMTLVLDRLKVYKNKITSTYIRQEVEGHNVHQMFVEPNKHLRNLCISRGAVRIYCSGGYTPITKSNEIAIPDYNMSGCGYFLMPDYVYRELTNQI